MGRKVRSEEGGSSSSSSAAGKLGAEAQFLVRAYESTGNRQTDEYVTKGTAENPYVALFEVGVSADLQFYDYAAYSDDANSSDQNITRTIITNAVAGGITMSNSTDYMRFSGSPTEEGEYLYVWKISNINTGSFDDGTARERKFYLKAVVLPSGSIPVYTDETSIKTIVARNSSDFTLVEAPSTPTNYQYAKYSISGDIPSYATFDNATGRVYAPSVPNLKESNYTSYTFTVTTTVSPDYSYSRTYTAELKVNDPFGSALFSILNTTLSSNSQVSYDAEQTAAVFDFTWGSGALQRSGNPVSYDTSPYIQGDGFGCQYSGLGQLSSDTWTWNSNAFGTGTQRKMSPFVSNSRYWIANGEYHTHVFTWVVPAGVTKFSVVAIGGGSQGAYSWANDGGGGAGLAWLNGISCEPGEEFYVGVGLGRYSMSGHGSYGAGASFMVRKSNGACLVYGGGAGYRPYSTSNPNGQSTSYHNGIQISGLTFYTASNAYGSNDSKDGGGYGYNENEGSEVNGFIGGGGVGSRDNGNRIGAGAGGYRNNTTNGSGSNGRGYGGGAGNGREYSSSYGYSAGGGTGVDGQGWGGDPGNTTPDNNSDAGSATNSSAPGNSYNGGSSPYRYSGGGGSGGTRGTYGENNATSHAESGDYWSQSARGIGGGLFGGGGGGSGTSYGGGNGAPGAVRIIWGTGGDGTERSFPYTYASERDDMKIPGVPD